MKTSTGDICTILRIGEQQAQKRVQDWEALCGGNVFSTSDKHLKQLPESLQFGIKFIQDTFLSWFLTRQAQAYQKTKSIVFSLTHPKDATLLLMILGKGLEKHENHLTRQELAAIVARAPTAFGLMISTLNMGIKHFPQVIFGDTQAYLDAAVKVLEEGVTLEDEERFDRAVWKRRFDSPEALAAYFDKQSSESVSPENRNSMMLEQQMFLENTYIEKGTWPVNEVVMTLELREKLVGWVDHFVQTVWA